DRPVPRGARRPFATARVEGREGAVDLEGAAADREASRHRAGDVLVRDQPVDRQGQVLAGAGGGGVGAQAAGAGAQARAARLVDERQPEARPGENREVHAPPEHGDLPPPAGRDVEVPERGQAEVAEVGEGQREDEALVGHTPVLPAFHRAYGSGTAASQEWDARRRQLPETIVPQGGTAVATDT